MGAMPSDYVKEAMMDRKHRRRERGTGCTRPDRVWIRCADQRKSSLTSLGSAAAYFKKGKLKDGHTFD